MKKTSFILLLILIFINTTTNKAWACACGCGVFDVGTSSMLPTQEGGMVFFNYYFLNQNKNWSGNSRAPAASNDDKQIKTDFFSIGTQHMFNRSWGMMMEVPLWKRHFSTTESGSLQSFDHYSIGDVRMNAIYSGFSDDMSSGLTFGVKLPTGDHTYANLERDIQIGTGSTDLSVGGYHMGNIQGFWNWYANGRWNQPVLIQKDYRPGSEANVVTGIYYNGWSIGGVKLAPLAQATGSYKYHDSGSAADSANSGYERFVLAPGIELDIANVKLNADVGFPVFQHVRGSQLVASQLYKLNLTYSF